MCSICSIPSELISVDPTGRVSYFPSALAPPMPRRSMAGHRQWGGNHEAKPTLAARKLESPCAKSEARQSYLVVCLRASRRAVLDGSHKEPNRSHEWNVWNRHRKFCAAKRRPIKPLCDGSHKPSSRRPRCPTSCLSFSPRKSPRACSAGGGGICASCHDIWSLLARL